MVVHRSCYEARLLGTPLAASIVGRCFRRSSRELQILQSHLLTGEGLEFLDPTLQLLDTCRHRLELSNKRLDRRKPIDTSRPFRKPTDTQDFLEPAEYRPQIRVPERPEAGGWL